VCALNRGGNCSTNGPVCSGSAYGTSRLNFDAVRWGLAEARLRPFRQRWPHWDYVAELVRTTGEKADIERATTNWL
jgi:hypothetical protein